MRDYLKTLKSLDDNVGRLLDYLEESGLAGNTLVVYTSDQGFYMGEHGWFDKRFMYEESLRTPLVMRMPGGAKGQIAEMVQNIDYAPTFLEPGRSARTRGHSGPVVAAPAAGGHPEDWRESIYYHFYEYPAEHMVKRHYGVRDERWKFRYTSTTTSTRGSSTTSKPIPASSHNLFGNPAYAAEQERMMKELVKLQTQYDDTAAMEKNASYDRKKIGRHGTRNPAGRRIVRGGSRTHRLRGSGGRGTSDAASPTTRNGLESGSYRLPERVRIGYDSPGLAATAGYLAEALAPYATATTAEGEGDITLSTDTASLAEEAYRLSVSRPGIRITAGSPRARRTASPRCGSCSRPAQSGKRRFPVRRSPTNRPSAGAGRCST